MGKQKGKPTTVSRAPKITPDIEDDADQSISDDGEVPAYSAALENESSDSEGAADEAMEGDQVDESKSDPDAHMDSASDPEDDQETSKNTTEWHEPNKSAWKAPTTEEVANIRAASQLFKSNAFKLKVEALLPQVRPKPSSKTQFESLLFTLHSHLRSIPGVAPQHPLNAIRKIRKLIKNKGKHPDLILSQPEPTEETNWKVSFEPPSAIQVVGSYADGLNVMGRDKVFVVDLAIEMPSSIFQEKDYLSSRFFHKRSYYIYNVYVSILSTPQLSNLFDAQLVYPCNNPRRTTLWVRPKNGSLEGKKFSAWIRIIPSVPFANSPIPLGRLAPAQSNLRSTNSDEASDTKPTPLYNNDLALSFTPTPHLLLIHTLKEQIPAFADAVALLRVWANQRGFAPAFSSPSSSSLTLEKPQSYVVGFDSIPSSIWSFFIMYATWGDDIDFLNTLPLSSSSKKKRRPRKKLATALSSYQLFRAVLDLLATQDFVEDPVRVRNPSSQWKNDSGWKWDGVGERGCFVTPGVPFNFFEGVPRCSLDLLRHDAKATLGALDHPSSSTSDGFEEAFLADQRDLQTRFDSLVQIDLSRVSESNDYHDSPNPTLASLIKLDTVLRKALGDRVSTFAFVQLSQPSSSEVSSSSLVTIGLVLDPENAPKLVEHGPPAEDEASCEVFRAFWGEKSEMRRFNDGRILESVVWTLTGQGVNERFGIPARIVQYIAQNHLGLDEIDVKVLDGAWDGAKLLSYDPQLVARLASNAVEKRANDESVQRMAISAFDGLVKSIKTLESLPLSLVNAIPASEGLRYTSTITPFPVSKTVVASLPDYAKFLPTFNIILQFEQSARWPDDLEAIQKVKVAFLEAMASGLLSSHAAQHAVVAWDVDASERPKEDHVSLEILHSSGFAFKARIQHERERTLMDRIITDKRAYPEGQRKRTSKALARWSHKFVTAPAHHAAILNLQRTFPAYSHTIRLSKRWLASHWLLGIHVSEEAIELLCADVFLNSGATGAVPVSGPTGFARTLAKIAQWDFKEMPLTIPVYSATNSETSLGPIKASVFPADALTKVQEAFTAHLATDSSLSKGAWTIATERDHSGHAFTSSITSLIASRIREIAKASVSYLNSSITSSTFNVKSIFTHPTDDYDFVIRLEDKLVTRYIENDNADPSVWGGGKKKYANLSMGVSSESMYGDGVRLGFDPVAMLVGELKRVYGDSAIFFHDSLGGTAIGGIWNPMLSAARPFRVLLGFSSQPVDVANPKKMTVTLNKAAILAEIERLGQGLVQTIDVRNS